MSHEQKCTYKCEAWPECGCAEGGGTGAATINAERTRFLNWIIEADPFDANAGHVERALKVEAAWTGWKAAVEAERERCEKVCLRVQRHHDIKAGFLTDVEEAEFHVAEALGAEDCADAIRMGEVWFANSPAKEGEA